MTARCALVFYKPAVTAAGFFLCSLPERDVLIPSSFHYTKSLGVPLEGGLNSLTIYSLDTEVSQEFAHFPHFSLSHYT